MLTIGKIVAGQHDYYEKQVAQGQDDYYTGRGEALLDDTLVRQGLGPQRHRGSACRGPSSWGWASRFARS
jgi:hypothetical protein